MRYFERLVGISGACYNQFCFSLRGMGMNVEAMAREITFLLLLLFL